MAKEAKGNARRALFKKGLTDAAKRSYDTRDSYGEGSDYLKKGIKVQKWIPKPGDHLIDLIPYIAGEFNPGQEEGLATHLLDIWVHRRVGPSTADYVCLAKNFKEPCPLCDLQKAMRKDGGYSEEDIKELQPKRRSLYNVKCFDTPEEERKGVQLWEVSFHFFEKHIAQLAKNPKGGGFIPFQDPDIGKSISFTIESKGGSNVEFIGHRFVDRDDVVSDDELDAAHVLDEIIHIPTYEELAKVAALISGKRGADADGEDEGATYEDEPQPARTGRGAANSRTKPAEADEYNADDENNGDGDEGVDDGIDPETGEPWDENIDPETGEPYEDPEPEPEPEPEPAPRRTAARPAARPASRPAAKDPEPEPKPEPRRTARPAAKPMTRTAPPAEEAPASTVRRPLRRR